MRAVDPSEPGWQELGVRRRVVDLESPPPRAQECPWCGASLHPIDPRDLRQVAFAWRCLPGKEPKTYELRCRSCARLLIVCESRQGGLVPTRDPEQSLRVATDLARDQIGREYDEKD